MARPNRGRTRGMPGGALLFGAIGGAALLLVILVAGLGLGPDRGGGAEGRISPHDLCEKGIAEHNQRHFDQAMKLWTSSAAAGNPTAALALGMLYDPVLFRENFTPVSPSDAESAARWYRAARIMGAPEAAARLADLDALKTSGRGPAAGSVPAIDIPRSCSTLVASEAQLAEVRSIFLAQAPVPPAGPDDPTARRPLAAAPGSSLYMRVLTRRNITPMMAPDAKARPAQQALPALTPYYVFGQQEKAGERWLELHPQSRVRDNDTVWLPETELIPWNQALVLTFAPRADRERALLFRKDADLRRVIDSPRRAEAVKELRARYCDNQADALRMVGGIEPEQPFDAKNFYFMPIISHSKGSLDGRPNPILHVAALNLLNTDTTADPGQVRCDYRLPPSGKVAAKPAVSPPRAAPAGPGRRPFRLGVAFVVDTTLSMGPYIDETKRALAGFRQSLLDSRDASDIGIALIGFRSSPVKRPKTEYDVEVFAPLEAVRQSTGFAEALDGLQEARFSTHIFQEDALFGVDTAIRQLDWSQYDSGVVVLVTDASSMEAGHEDDLVTARDNVPGSRFSAGTLRRLAEDKNLYLSVVHILSPQGEANGDHERAREQYGRLATTDRRAHSLYYPINADHARSYGRELSRFLPSITALKKSIDEGVKVEAPESTDFGASMALIGRPMQIRFYGESSTERPTEVFSAWISDHDLELPMRRDISVRVLLTKDQLSRLAGAVDRIIETAQFAGNDTNTFFAKMQELAGGAVLDPGRIGATPNIKSLGEVGHLDDLLRDLPYRSEILGLTAADWSAMTARDVHDFLTRLKAKRSYYQELHDTPERWTRLSPDMAADSALVALDLDQLP